MAVRREVTLALCKVGDARVFDLLLTTLAFNLVGDGLRDALDPRTGR